MDPCFPIQKYSDCGQKKSEIFNSSQNFHFEFLARKKLKIIKNINFWRSRYFLIVTLVSTFNDFNSHTSCLPIVSLTTYFISKITGDYVVKYHPILCPKTECYQWWYRSLSKFKSFRMAHLIWLITSFSLMESKINDDSDVIDIVMLVTKFWGEMIFIIGGTTSECIRFW